MYSRKAAAAALTAVLMLVTSSAWAEGPAQEAGASSDMEKMQARMMEYGTPGEAHERLDPLVGTWEVTSTMWPAPGTDPETTTATSTISWVLGGRFLRQQVNGDWNGQAFEGLGMLGYANQLGHHELVWMDNVSTGMVHSTARYDASAGKLLEEGSYACPMTGEPERWFRGEWTLPAKGDDTMTYTMYSKDEHGTEFRSMQMEYRRTK